jgi:hypothetical protein
MDKLHNTICTRHTFLCIVVGIETGCGGTGEHAFVGGGVGIVIVGRLPGALCVIMELQLTQALLRGFQYLEPVQMAWT